MKAEPPRKLVSFAQQPIGTGRIVVGDRPHVHGDCLGLVLDERILGMRFCPIAKSSEGLAPLITELARGRDLPWRQDQAAMLHCAPNPFELFHPCERVEIAAGDQGQLDAGRGGKGREGRKRGGRNFREVRVSDDRRERTVDVEPDEHWAFELEKRFEKSLEATHFPSNAPR